MRRFTLIGCALAIMATPAIVSAQDKPQAEPEKLICKSTLATGSLVKRVKKCFSKTDWQRIQEAAFQGGRELQERNTGSVQ